MLLDKLITIGFIHSSFSAPIKNNNFDNNAPSCIAGAVYSSDEEEKRVKLKSANPDDGECKASCWYDAYDKPISFAIEMNSHAPEWLSKTLYREVIQEAFKPVS